MRREVIAGFVVWAVLSASPAVAKQAPKLLGDESDGSRAHPLHLIPLFAENEDGLKGEQVDPEGEPPMPFSTRWTCGECHSYDIIKQGWHFNATDSNAPAGRPGEPWLYFDHKLGIQIPLSYRAWPGAYRPDEFGMTSAQFTQIFGRHMPGGGPGELPGTDPEGVAKQYVSGKLEINCLACHNAHPGQDQGSPTGYAVQVSKTNFRWAAAASCEFAKVAGSVTEAGVTYDPFMPEEDDKKAPRVTYDTRAFDDKGNVLLQIVREVPNHRCYFCHSDLHSDGSDERPERWCADEDIHMTAGLKCVDCHRNGLAHSILRGSEEEAAESGHALAGTTTCRGCHIGNENGHRPDGGRLGAPVPEHKGIPTVHFERLACTACHSGPWPDEQTGLAKTARAHRMGTPNSPKDVRVLPHVITPVFARLTTGESDDGKDAKIAPHRLIWPAFWGTLTENNDVEPIALAVLEKVLGPVMKDVTAPATGDWGRIEEGRIAKALRTLSDSGQKGPVYVTGGQLFQLGEDGELAGPADHPAAAPYMWPVGHNVRPAAQSLGVGKCTVCHSTGAPFFFGSVAVDSPVASVSNLVMKQYQFQRAPHGRTWAFAWSFVFRPWFKVVAIGSTAVIGIVLLLYGLRALGAVAKVLAEQE